MQIKVVNEKAKENPTSNRLDHLVVHWGIVE